MAQGGYVIPATNNWPITIPPATSTTPGVMTPAQVAQLAAAVAGAGAFASTAVTPYNAQSSDGTVILTAGGTVNLAAASSVPGGTRQTFINGGGASLDIVGGASTLIVNGSGAPIGNHKATATPFGYVTVMSDGVGTWYALVVV